MITVVVGKEIEKIKGDFESYLNGLNMVGEISYSQYSKLYDEGTKQIQKAYELGKSELEKENAELKEALKGKVCNCMTYLNFKDLEKECAKAKVFIRSLKSLIEDVCDINYLSKDNTRLLVEAEQFLNEVEK